MIVLPEILRTLQEDILAPERVAAAIEAVLLLALIAVAAWVVLHVSRRLLERAARERPGNRTILPIADSLIRSAVVFTALVLMLGAVRVNITALLASAGVVGVALGFGAQYLIRDVLAGVFLLSEGVAQVGDIVRLDGDTGTVERLTLRVIQIRKANGELLTVPNGQVGRIGNLSRDYGVAIVKIPVPYRAELPAVLETLRGVASEWAAANANDARGEPTVDGTVDLQDTGVVVQLSARVRPGRQWAVEADLRQRALRALAARGIRIDARVSVTLPGEGGDTINA